MRKDQKDLIQKYLDHELATAKLWRKNLEPREGEHYTIKHDEEECQEKIAEAEKNAAILRSILDDYQDVQFLSSEHLPSKRDKDDGYEPTEDEIEDELKRQTPTREGVISGLKFWHRELRRKFYSGYYEMYDELHCRVPGWTDSSHFQEDLTLKQCQKLGLMPYDQWMLMMEQRQEMESQESEEDEEDEDEDEDEGCIIGSAESNEEPF